MYDNIKLYLPYPFSNETELNEFCTRFCLFEKNEKKGSFNNRGYEDLTQNKGVFIRVDVPKGNKKGAITINVSLHKFYNYNTKKEPFNYNSFSFKQANKAGRMLKDMFIFDIGKAVVKKYEVGLNVVTSKEPDIYLKELKQVNVKAKQLRILEDLHFKEYKQYSTNKDKYKRVVYIFYNKTHEARSKLKSIERREDVPDNVLRAEKDTRRPFEKIYFNTLFDSVFQKKEKQDFKERFVNDLVYTEIPTKPAKWTRAEFDIYIQLANTGETWVKNYYKKKLENNEITKSWYYRILKKIDILKNQQTEIKNEVSNEAKELKLLLNNALTEV